MLSAAAAPDADRASISVADLAGAGLLPARWAPHRGACAVLVLGHLGERLEVLARVRVDLARLRLDLGATAASPPVPVVLSRRLLRSTRGLPRGRWYMTAPCCGRRCLVLLLSPPERLVRPPGRAGTVQPSSHLRSVYHIARGSCGPPRGPRMRTCGVRRRAVRLGESEIAVRVSLGSAWARSRTALPRCWVARSRDSQLANSDPPKTPSEPST